MLERIAGSPVSRRELRLLIAAMALGFLVRAVFILVTRGYTAGPDELEYIAEGAFISHGQWFWTELPYQIAHEGLWKAPGYPTWVGIVFTIFGSGLSRLLLLQALVLGPLTIFLTWVLGKRLFTHMPNLAVGAAFLVAVYPNAWQWEVRVTAEAVSTPLTLLALILVLARPPTPRRAIVLGLVLGAGLLVRPTAFLLFAGVAAAYIVAVGWRRGAAMTAVAVVAAIVVVAPWTIRNYNLTDEFIPISLQDAAAYGTFNDDAANDENFPWAWRPRTTRDEEVLTVPRPDAEFRSILIDRAREYALDNPASVPQAFFWNGLIRTWDLRAPSEVTFEAPYEGRSKGVAAVGLAFYWVLLVFAIATLWRYRKRRELLMPVLAIALATSVVFTVAAATRYRAPLEPLIVVLACASLPLISRPGTGRGPAGTTF